MALKKHNHLLLSFINAVLENKKQPLIKSAKVENPFDHRNYKMEKKTILDIKATDEKERTFDIEFQTSDKGYTNEKFLYYWARQYAKKVQKGNDYYNLKPVIGINLLTFKPF